MSRRYKERLRRAMETARLLHEVPTAIRYKGVGYNLSLTATEASYVPNSNTRKRAALFIVRGDRPIETLTNLINELESRDLI